MSTLYTTIAKRNTEEAVKFLRSKGVNIPENINIQNPEVIKKIGDALADFARQTQEKGIAELKEIHPDKELFIGQEHLNIEGFKNCEGCPMKKNFCSADAATPAKTATVFDSKTLNIAIIATTVIIAGGFLTYMIVSLTSKK